MAQGDLDLLERFPALVGELGEGAPQVMRRDVHTDQPTVGRDRLEDRLRLEREVAGVEARLKETYD